MCIMIVCGTPILRYLDTDRYFDAVTASTSLDISTSRHPQTTLFNWILEIVDWELDIVYFDPNLKYQISNIKFHYGSTGLPAES